MHTKSLLLSTLGLGLLTVVCQPRLSVSTAHAKSAAPASDRADDKLSLQETEFFAKLTEEMEPWVRLLNEDCGTAITADYDKATVRPHFDPQKESLRGLSTYARGQAQGVLSAIEDICKRSEAGKGAVKKSITRVVIRVSTGGKGPMNVTLSGGVVTGTVDLTSGGGAMEELAGKILKKKL